MLLEEHIDEIARIITNECGKTLAESVGEMRRGIENVEVACGMPILMQGYNNEDIARGIDEHMIRQPLGVVAAITPFNFPGMIPLWFLPYAVARGNCFILKPSEKVLDDQPEALRAAGSRPASRQAWCSWSTAARRRSTRCWIIRSVRADQLCGFDAGGQVRLQPGHGQRQARPMPGRGQESGRHHARRGHGDDDTDHGRFGLWLRRAALPGRFRRHHGGRGRRHAFTEGMADAAASRVVGYGLDDGVQMGPVITAESKARIEGLIEQGTQEGANVLVDGRQRTVDGYEDGYWVFPTILDDVDPARRDCQHRDLRPGAQPDARRHHRRGHRAGQPTQLRQHGLHLHRQRRGGPQVPQRGRRRQRRHQHRRGRAHGLLPLQRLERQLLRRSARARPSHGIEFYTQTKVVVERWPREWSGNFLTSCWMRCGACEVHNDIHLTSNGLRQLQ